MRPALIIAVSLILLGAVLFKMRSRPEEHPGLDASRFKTGAREGPGASAPPVVSRNTPVVLAFTGDLANKGVKNLDGSVVPFVAGDILSLNAEALNAVEYRWTANGEPVRDRGQEWSHRADREFPVDKEGPYKFSLQVRAADPAVVSAAKDAALTVAPLFIEEFDKAIIHNGDRALTGEQYTLQVRMALPVTGSDDFYRYRYVVNDTPVRHPEDNEEWTVETQFTYTFPAPGEYAFKVEVRRADRPEKEAESEMPETITVADAVLLTFDAFPENSTPVGTRVELSAFPESRLGKSECRFGVRRVNAAGYEWITEENGAVWGRSERAWLPTLPGNYLIRAELREIGKQQVDDSREILYSVSEGTF